MGKKLKAEPKKAKAKAKAADILKRPASICPNEPAAVAEPNNGRFAKKYRTQTNLFLIRKKWKNVTKDFKGRS